MASVAGNVKKDPTLPKVKLEINGRELYLAYDFNSIAVAEELTGLNILEDGEFSNLSARKFRAVLYSALLKNQPDITLEEVGDLINRHTSADITIALVHAWTGSNPEVIERKEEDTENPPQEQTDPS